MNSLIEGDVLETLHGFKNNSFEMIFADPPDNIGLEYNTHDDEREPKEYYRDIHDVILESLRVAPTVWISYYWKHDVPIKTLMGRIKEHYHPSVKIKTFIWHFTFGQHQQTDCGSCFRFLVRLTKVTAKIRTDNIRETSVRQQIGDKRASSKGRVPGDVWTIPRVVGNCHERRSWHPTQHPEELIRRIVLFSTDEGDRVLDLYTGTGTMFRACKFIGRSCVGVELDPEYCKNLREEHSLT